MSRFARLMKLKELLVDSGITEAKRLGGDQDALAVSEVGRQSAERGRAAGAGRAHWDEDCCEEAYRLSFRRWIDQATLTAALSSPRRVPSNLEGRGRSWDGETGALL